MFDAPEVGWSKLANLLRTIGPEGFLRRNIQQRAKPEKCLVVMHVHVLPSLVALVARLIEIGFPAAQIVVIGKTYSVIEKAADDILRLGAKVYFNPDHDGPPGDSYRDYARTIHHGCRLALRVLERFACQRVVLVDDGGLLTETWYKDARHRREEVVSIQQTASGLFRSRRPEDSPYWKIDVARSAGKTVFESAIIASGVIAAAEARTALSKAGRVGVAGVGHLGRKIVQRLSQRGPVAAFDQYPRAMDGLRVKRCGSQEEFLASSDIVFGCTGRNFLRHADVDTIDHNVAMVSCSSRDVEFLSVMQFLKPWGKDRHDILSDLEYRVNRRTITLYNGGFPINFDRRTEWEPLEEIAITRALILISVVQALFLDVAAAQGEIICPLDAEMQMQATLHWLAWNKREPGYFGASLSRLSCLQWWNDHSGPERCG